MHLPPALRPKRINRAAAFAEGKPPSGKAVLFARNWVKKRAGSLRRVDHSNPTNLSNYRRATKRDRKIKPSNPNAPTLKAVGSGTTVNEVVSKGMFGAVPSML
jgi:hypothetical protein